MHMAFLKKWANQECTGTEGLKWSRCCIKYTPVTTAAGRTELDQILLWKLMLKSILGQTPIGYQENQPELL